MRRPAGTSKVTSANILLFATRRGGSTFAMELIAANRGDPPARPAARDPGQEPDDRTGAGDPAVRQGQITSLDEPDAPGAPNDLVDADLRRRGGDQRTDCGSGAGTSTCRSNRLVLKLMDCKAVIGWFDDTFDVDIVYFTRNPIPQSLSCIRNGWTLTTRRVPRRSCVRLERLSPSGGLALAHDVAASDNALRHSWSTGRWRTWRLRASLAERPAWTHVRYEDTVREPHATFERLSNRLGLPDRRTDARRPDTALEVVAAVDRGDPQHIAAGRAPSPDFVETTRRRRRHRVDARDTLNVFDIDPDLVGGW